MADLAPWATPDQVSAPWRPLSPAEKQRAEALIGSVSRDIDRRWPALRGRVAAGTVNAADVADVVTWLVLPVLGGPPTPGAKSWQVTSGSESRSITLDQAGNPRDPWVYAPWMLDILDGSASARQATPSGSFPEPGPFEGLFPEWPEGRR